MQIPPASSEELIFGAADTNGSQTYSSLVENVSIYNYAMASYAIANDYLQAVPTDHVCIDRTGLEFDYDNDSDVDFADMFQFASHWLNCNRFAGSESKLVNCL